MASVWGGQKVAVLGVEDEDESHQDGEQTFVEMLRAVSRRATWISVVLGRSEAAEQLVQGP